MKNTKGMVLLKISMPSFSQMIETFGLKLEKGKKPKFVKPHNLAIIFYVALLIKRFLICTVRF